MQQKSSLVGYGTALGSAALVGLFTVLNKWILSEAVPAFTAGSWTYLAAGVALAPWALRAGGLRFKRPWVAVLWLFAGSVMGPALYFLGLSLTSGIQGVLMINLEAVFTAILAFAIFHERLTSLGWLASVTVLAGATWLSLPAHGGTVWAGTSLGNLLIGLGYLAWATENNLGRLLTEEVPTVTLVCVKALIAGVVMAALAAAFGQSLSIPWHVVPGIVASGAFSLGLSLALFYVAMRHIGAGRTGLISSTSALWGVIGSIALLGESLTLRVVTGGLLVLAGLSGFVRESMLIPERD